MDFPFTNMGKSVGKEGLEMKWVVGSSVLDMVSLSCLIDI